MFSNCGCLKCLAESKLLEVPELLVNERMAGMAADEDTFFTATGQHQAGRQGRKGVKSERKERPFLGEGHSHQQLYWSLTGSQSGGSWFV